MERGVLCDVFVAIRPNLYITGFLDLNVNTTVTYWFLAVSIEVINGPRCEKTCLWGFRQTETQQVCLASETS